HTGVLYKKAVRKCTQQVSFWMHCLALFCATCQQKQSTQAKEEKQSLNSFLQLLIYFFNNFFNCFFNYIFIQRMPLPFFLSFSLRSSFQVSSSTFLLFFACRCQLLPAFDNDDDDCMLS